MSLKFLVVVKLISLYSYCHYLCFLLFSLSVYFPAFYLLLFINFIPMLTYGLVGMFFQHAGIFPKLLIVSTLRNFHYTVTIKA